MELEEILKNNHDSLLKSGMFWEFYPELTGEYKKDKKEFARHKLHEVRIHIQKGIVGERGAEEWINFLEQII